MISRKMFLIYFLLINLLQLIAAQNLINLCDTDKNSCSEICTDANNGINVVCSCYHGYKLDTDEVTCMDIDECAINPCPHGQECENLAGGYECFDTSRPDYRRRTDMRSRPIPRSELNSDTSRSLPPYDIDDNWMVAVTKLEPKGDSDFKYDPGARNPNAGNALHVIPRKSAAGSSGLPYSVAKSGPRCPTGYREHPNHPEECVDIDECADGNADCTEEPYVLCQNLFGKFTCVPTATMSNSKVHARWRLSQIADGNKVDAVGDQCAPGLRKRTPYSECLDIDECALNSHNCDLRSELCENIIGDYKCVPINRRQYEYAREDTNPRNQPLDSDYRTRADPKKEEEERRLKNKNPDGSCKRGFEHNRLNQGCDDIDECVDAPCPPSLTCLNYEGGFNCDCARGYMLINGSCADIDECSLGNFCSAHEKCVNLPGRYTCAPKPVECKNGVVLNPRKNRCVDIDECSLNIHSCKRDQKCVNTFGSYECRCRYGYMLDANGTCADVDECVIYDNAQTCDAVSVCVNNIGSYDCVCKDGYERNENDACVDVDECADMRNSTELCAHACRNTIGSYECACHPGYQIDPNNTRACIDVDECEHDSKINSDSDQSFNKGIKYCQGFCFNTNGSYECACPPGYTLNADGKSCDDIDECAREENDESSESSAKLTLSGANSTSDANSTIDADVADGPCAEEKDICLNTRGGFKCYKINCPENYVRDDAHPNRCRRNGTIACADSDQELCLSIPGVINHYYLTLPSAVPIQNPGHLDLFSLRGHKLPSTEIIFTIDAVNSTLADGADAVEPADEGNFFLRNVGVNEQMVSIRKPINGPQDIELHIAIQTFYRQVLSASSKAIIFLHVSKFNY